MSDLPQQLSLLVWAEGRAGVELPPAEEVISRLKAMVPEEVEIIFTRNRSSLITVRRGTEGKKVVRIQEVFRAADAATLSALARFIVKPDRRCRHRIDGFLEDRRDLLWAVARPPRKSPAERTRGNHRDLKGVLRKVSEEYGLRVPRVRISWGKRRKLGKRQASIKFGSFNYHSRTILLHPELDRPEVPDYFVEYIVYHELLHALFPPTPGHAARKTAHGREFRRFERKFKEFTAAREFELQLVKRILR